MSITLRLLSIALVATLCVAQVPQGGKPVSSTETSQRLDAVHTIQASINTTQLMLEDAAVKTKDEIGGKRVGVVVDVNKDLSSFQTEILASSVVYRLAITSKGALGMGINFAKYQMANGASLFVYNKDKTMVRGGFTSWNHKENGEFAVMPVSGDTIIVEINAPKGTPMSDFSIVIASIVHHYQPTRMVGAFKPQNNTTRERRGFGDSGACNVNVACEGAAAWDKQVRGNAMILTSSGSRLCSGSMINNNAEDGRQYFLTALHCGTNNAASWIFVFNYDSPTCANPPSAPSVDDSVQGTRLIASNGNSDFGLLELVESIPASYGVFLNGFNANDDNEFEAPFSISHPSGDIKKYAKYGGLATPEGYFGPGVTHWLIPAWEVGVTEGGSSGSPIYDSQHRIRGQLHGGYAACDYLYIDYYGRLSQSWDIGTSSSTHLSTWLDPERSGTRVCDGVDLNEARAKHAAKLKMMTAA